MATLKNKNEFTEDGKKFIKNANACYCEEKIGDSYVVMCKLNERGKREYLYKRGYGYISSQFNCRKLWLDGFSETNVNRAADEFDERLKKAKNGTFAKVDISALNVRLYYKRVGTERYDCLIEQITPSENASVKCLHLCELKKITGEITWPDFDVNTEEEKKLIEILDESDEETINENPLYISAVENGDKIMQIQLKRYYDIATDEEREWLSSVIHDRVLPELPDNYDKDFAVQRDTIDELMLLRSGYKVLHRPCFAMKGSTHKYWALNPHTKCGVDAVAENTEGICFGEYLALFPLPEIKNK